MNDKTIYKEPGAGAKKFSEQFLTGITEYDTVVMKALIDGRLYGTKNNRVKNCDYCGYRWYDDSLRNTKKTCSPECKTGIKTIQRRKQRERKELAAPKEQKPTLQDDYYHWFEYPYWINESSMTKRGWKFEKPLSIEVRDAVITTRSIYGEGNRKVTTKDIF